MYAMVLRMFYDNALSGKRDVTLLHLRFASFHKITGKPCCIHPLKSYKDARQGDKAFALQSGLLMCTVWISTSRGVAEVCQAFFIQI